MHSHGSKNRGEHFSHNGFIIGKDRHLLIKEVDELHGIRPRIVNGECRLREPMRKFGLVNPPDEGWFRNLL